MEVFMTIKQLKQHLPSIKDVIGLKETDLPKEKEKVLIQAFIRRSYSQEHPMTLILRNTNNYDWYYSTTERTDNQRWNSQKTMYDPCPSGWRVPDGGKRGIWKLSNIDDTEPDSQNKGIAFEIDNNKML